MRMQIAKLHCFICTIHSNFVHMVYPEPPERAAPPHLRPRYDLPYPLSYELILTSKSYLTHPPPPPPWVVQSERGILSKMLINGPSSNQLRHAEALEAVTRYSPDNGVMYQRSR